MAGIVETHSVGHPSYFPHTEWFNILQARLRTQGLDLSDLPDVEHVTEVIACDSGSELGNF